MADFYIGVGDTGAYITDQLQDASGAALDLQGASVTFTMVDQIDGTVAVNAAAAQILVPNPTNLTGPTDPNVAYHWQAGDTATAGVYQAYWRVELAGGQLVRVPNARLLTVQVTRR